ncbi:15-hydroxyprostaglandin dehydrogenase [NAD(+)]-like [Menidia menidia]
MALNNKIAVVTGAVMGIGRAVTETLLQHGAKVALLDVNEIAGKNLTETLNQQHGTGKALFLKCDVQSEQEIKDTFQKTVETFGGIDIVCNNAGILNEETWEKAVSTNLMGVIRGTYVGMEHMNKLTGGRGGVIINMASMAGIGPFPSCPVYTATKHGVVGFTRAMGAASEASGYGIRFNVICPSFVQTDFLANIPEKLGRFSHLADAAHKLVDTLGILSVSEVIECFLELATDESKNGEALVVFPKGKTYAKFPSVL